MVSYRPIREQKRLLRGLFSRKSPYLISLLLGISAFFWQWVDGTAASLVLIVIVMLSQWLAIAVGYLFFLFFYSPLHCCAWRDFDALIVGNILISVLLLVLVYFFGVDVVSAFAVIGLVIISGAYFFQTRFSTKATIEVAVDWNAVFVLVIVIAIVSFVSVESLNPFVIGEESVIFKPWNDLFIHTANTMMITSGDQVSAGRFEALGEPAKLYHYGSYMLPALLFQCGLVSGLEAITAFWSPIGLVFMALAMFSLGKFMWGQNIALISTIIVMLLPDASYQFFKPVYFSFDWLLKASPGCSWGLAVFCLALKLNLEGISRERLGLCALAMLLAGMLLFFRAQFALVSTVFLLLVFLLYFETLAWQRRVIIGFLSLLACWVSLIVIGPHLSNPTLIGPPGGKEFITFFLSPIYTSQFLGFDLGFPQSNSTGLWLASAIFILVLSVHGISIVLYPMALALNNYFRNVTRFALIPVIFLFVYLVYSWFMPKNSGGNDFEMQHRPFLITYLVMLLWATGLSLTFVRNKITFSWSATGKRCAILSAILLLFGLQFTIPTIVDVPGREQLNSSFPRGLYEVSRALKTKHSNTDRFLDSGLDPAEFVIAVSETRSFLSRPQRRSIIGNSSRAAFYSDLNLRSQHILASDNPDLLRETANSEGIRWIISGPDDTFRWREKMEPTYTNRGYSLYHIGDESFSR